MTAREIWDISPLLFFINFEITLADTRDDFKIDKKNSCDISSQITPTAM